MISSKPLIARAERELGRARFEATFIASPRVSIIAVRRTGIVFDARFVSGLRSSPGEQMLYLLLEGSVEAGHADVERFDAPCALSLDADTFEGLLGRDRATFRNFGEPFVLVELRLPRGCVPSAPRDGVAHLTVPDDVWDAARRLAARPAADDVVARDASALLTALQRAGVVVDDEPDARTAFDAPKIDLSRLFPPALDRKIVDSLEALASGAGVSLRSATRRLELFAATFRSPFTGWRETTRRLRLKLAVMALSTVDMSIREVARAAGFGSVEAMDRAFRDAGAPAPRAIRDELHEARARLVAERPSPTSSPRSAPR